VITLDNVVLGHAGRPLLRPISISVSAGDFWGIVGPNGAGKSTLIKTIVGLIPAVGGAVQLAQPLPRFGYVPQQHALSAHYPLTAFDVVLMGRTGMLRLGQRPKAQDLARTHEELSRIGMAAVAQHQFAALSGGQKQRVLMARALVSDPDVLVLDEPTAGMDLPGEESILAFLRRLHAERKMAVLMVGHHISNVARVATHLCLINKDTSLFEAGPAAALLTSTCLSRVYNQPIAVERVNGAVQVFAQEQPHD